MQGGKRSFQVVALSPNASPHLHPIQVFMDRMLLFQNASSASQSHTLGYVPVDGRDAPLTFL